MRIIENLYKNVEKEKEYLVSCEECGSRFAVTKDDVTYGQFGCPKVICPCCGREAYVDAEGLEMELTANNVKYPDHYYTFVLGQAYPIADHEINSWVRELIKMLEEDETMDYATRSCGDTHVAVYKHDEEISVVVSKGYAETSVPIKERKKKCMQTCLFSDPKGE